MSSRRSGARSPDEPVSSSSTYFSSAERPIPAGSECAVVDSCTSSRDQCSDDALDCRPVPSLRIQNTGQYRFSWPRRLEVVHNGHPRVMVMPDWAQSTPLDEEELPQGSAKSESLFSSVVGVTSQDSEPVVEQPTSNKTDSSSHTTDDRPGSCVDRSPPVTDAPTGCAASTEESCATSTRETRAEPAVTHPPSPDSPNRQCRSTVTPSQRRESPITPSRRRESPITPRRQLGFPVTPSRQCESPITPSRQCESPVTSSRQRGSPVTPSRQCESTVTPNRQCESPITPSRQCESPVTSSRRLGSPVALSRQCGSPVTPSRQLAGGCSKRECLTPVKTTPAKRVAFSPGAGGDASPRTGRSVDPGHPGPELMSNQWCVIPRTSFLDAALNAVSDDRPRGDGLAPGRGLADRDGVCAVDELPGTSAAVTNSIGCVTSSCSATGGSVISDSAARVGCHNDPGATASGGVEGNNASRSCVLACSSAFMTVAESGRFVASCAVTDVATYRSAFANATKNSSATVPCVQVRDASRAVPCATVAISAEASSTARVAADLPHRSSSVAKAVRDSVPFARDNVETKARRVEKANRRRGSPAAKQFVYHNGWKIDCCPRSTSLEPEGLYRYVGTVPCVVLLTPSKQITPPDSAERFLIYS